jgi:hypothetical protein
MVIVGVRGGGVAGGVGLDPFHAVLDQFADGSPRLVGTVDEQNQAFHADLAKIRVPVHEPADAADFAAARRQLRSRRDIVFDRFLSHTSMLNRLPPERAAV